VTNWSQVAQLGRTALAFWFVVTNIEIEGGDVIATPRNVALVPSAFFAKVLIPHSLSFRLCERVFFFRRHARLRMQNILGMLAFKRTRFICFAK